VSYPAHLASDVVLRDGSTVALRPVEKDDEQLLLDFFRAAAGRTLEAVAALTAAHAEIAALELDPLLLRPHGSPVAATARIVVGRPPERRPWLRTWE